MKTDKRKVIITGSVGFDDVKTPFGFRETALGGSAVYSSWACSFFNPAGMIGVAGADFSQDHLKLLNARDIDTEGLLIKQGKTFRWRGEYGSDFNTAHTLSTELNVMDGFSPVVPESYRGSDFLFLANIDPAVQLEVAKAVGASRIIAADTMNFWIEHKRAELLRVIELCSILFVNDSEARQLTSESNITRACSRIMEMGPDTVVVKQGEYGATMFYSDRKKGAVRVFSVPSIPLDSVIDPTGAGDSFAGGFMGYLASCGRSDEAAVRSAVAVGSVVASFTVEGFSLETLMKTDIQNIMSRYSRLKDISLFGDFLL